MCHEVPVGPDYARRLRCSATSPYGSPVEHSEVLEPTAVIALRVREARARHGFTAQQLADRLKAVGVPWDRATVTKLETGRRQNISTVELLALARALDVAPVHLLLPVDDRPFMVTPTEIRPAERVRAWVRGEKPLPGTDLRIFHTEVPLEEVRAVRTVRFGGRHGSKELQALVDEEEQRSTERQQSGDDDTGDAPTS